MIHAVKVCLRDLFLLVLLYWRHGPLLCWVGLLVSSFYCLDWNVGPEDKLQSGAFILYPKVGKILLKAYVLSGKNE